MYLHRMQGRIPIGREDEHLPALFRGSISEWRK
jgi:hypothetical protein